MFYWFIVFVLSFLVSLLIGTFKDRKRYMLVVLDEIKYFSTFEELKKYVSKNVFRCDEYKIFVKDVKEYIYLTDAID